MLIWVLIIPSAYSWLFSRVNYVTKQGPPGSDFGFKAVAGRNEFFVGSPGQDFSFYVCKISKSKTCDKIDLPQPSQNDEYEILTSQSRLGATLDYQNDTLLICAPNLKVKIWKTSGMPGACFLYQNMSNMSNPKFSMPCFDEKYPNGFLSIYDSCLSGFSGKLMAGGEAIFSSPNFALGVGGITTSSNLIYFDRKDKYFGFDFAFWKAVDGFDYFFVSALKGSHNFGGVVYLLETNKTSFDIKWKYENSDFGSLFGYSVKIGDSNNDGFNELFVSAPFYWTQDFAGRRRSGVIFHYFAENEEINETTTPKIISYSHRNEHFDEFTSNFGFSFDVQDINNDSFDDLIVGEPNVGNGRVYVYLGSKNGLSESPNEIIKAEELKCQVSQFGYSVAKGGDFDSNGYMDILVGAKKSDSIIMLFSTPNVYLTYNMSFYPPTVQQAINNSCLFQGIRGICIESTITINSDKNTTDTINIKYKLRIEHNLGGPSAVFLKTGIFEESNQVNISPNSGTTFIKNSIFVEETNIHYFENQRITFNVEFTTKSQDLLVFSKSLQPITRQVILPELFQHQYFLYFKDTEDSTSLETKLKGDLSNLKFINNSACFPTNKIFKLSFNVENPVSTKDVVFQINSTFPLIVNHTDNNIACNDKSPDLLICSFKENVFGSNRILYFDFFVQLSGIMEILRVPTFEAAIKTHRGNIIKTTWKPQNTPTLLTYHSIHGISNYTSNLNSTGELLVRIVHQYEVEKNSNVGYPMTLSLWWPSSLDYEYEIHSKEFPQLQSGNCSVDTKFQAESKFGEKQQSQRQDEETNKCGISDVKDYVLIKCTINETDSSSVVKIMSDFVVKSKFKKLSHITSVACIHKIKHFWNTGQTRATVVTKLESNEAKVAKDIVWPVYLAIFVGFLIFSLMIIVTKKTRSYVFKYLK